MDDDGDHFDSLRVTRVIDASHVDLGAGISAELIRDLARVGDIVDAENARRAGLSRVYFTQRRGLRWEVWWRFETSESDLCSGAIEWRALWGVRFWRRLNAERATLALAVAYVEGLRA